MIKKIKETLGQIFFSPEASGSWIHDVEGAIDEDDGLDYEDQYYTGVPAPSILEDDPWFGPTPPLTEKQEEIRAQLEEEKQLIAEEEDKSPSKEVANIHEVMYNVATSNGNACHISLLNVLDKLRVANIIRFASDIKLPKKRGKHTAKDQP